MPQILYAPNLSEFPNLIHGFTTKELGNDYDRISQAIKVLPSQIYSLKQIHSDKVVYIDQGMDLVHLPEGDALVTDRKDILIGIKTADCVPLLVYDSNKEVIAAIHAGYKGMLAGIIQKTLRIMIESLHCNFDDMYFSLGPSISCRNYEVGEEIIGMFLEKYDDRFVYQQVAGEKPHLDLKGTAQIILEDLGMDPLHFINMNLCTYELGDLFFSYRRQKGEGRLFSFIGMLS